MIFRNLPAALVLSSSLFFLSCTSQTSPTNDGQMMVSSSLTTSSVYSTSPATKGENAVQAVDSISIDRCRILFSRVKAHRADTSEGGGKDAKVGPALLTFTDVTSLVFATSLPTGSYQRIKLEMHKFSSKEAADFKDDPTFGDFAYPEKLTIIIDGIQYKDGADQPFTLTFDDTENFWLLFDAPLEIKEGATAEAILNLDVMYLFKIGGLVLDVNDIENRKELRKRIKMALKLYKKVRI